MDFGDLVGKAAGAIGGGDFDLAETLGGAGIDAEMLKGLDLSAAKSFIEEKRVDLSILDTLGLDLDALLAKFLGDA